MQFFKIASLLAAAVLATAENTITFISQDDDYRTLYFTGNPGMTEIKPVQVQGLTNVTVDIPYQWIGNFFAVVDGQPVVPGMLGEVAFNSWNGITFFDVSAIVNPSDHVGVKVMWPVDSPEPFSGCDLFPCNFAYYAPNDVQTRATHGSDLYCTLGTSPHDLLASRSLSEETLDAPVFARDFVQGRWASKN
ncbi:DNase1 protein [Lasiosphaeria miniovina]|uniref:DNase1 protein n=1 Tax=Lasiosphaeria miniovina TaxID=1954250 RepID=A0AA40B5H4_9PEZI|nr:DNase1 protein [Lasiosphaeria miniovina]KAK0727922.1 DNase1 protein [Lasiosphaeria miniovina]